MMPREIVHRGRRIAVAIDESVGPNGEVIRRDMIFHPGAVVVLPIIDREQICLLRNYRFVIEETLWEIPAGTLEPGEVLEAAARRELEEESGYTAATMTAKGFFYASPGVLDEKLHLFFAEGLTAGTARPEVDEQLEPVVLRLDDAVAMILAGEIRDAKTITAILLYERTLRCAPIV